MGFSDLPQLFLDGKIYKLSVCLVLKVAALKLLQPYSIIENFMESSPIKQTQKACAAFKPLQLHAVTPSPRREGL